MDTISDTIYRAYEKKLLKLIKECPVPNHLAIIMDGNRRFAEERGLDPKQGHQYGRDKLEELMDWTREVGIKILTVYAFSMENATRTREELNTLYKLFVENFRKLGDDARVHKYKIRVKVLGQIELLPKNVQDAIRYAEERTKRYSNYYFNLAVAYGGRAEIVQAIKRIASDAKSNKINIENIDEALVSSYLYTKEFPDPDLILRTSGEVRISNFLLWQLAYSELYFTDVYWPGFKKIDFLRAIRSYQLRHRRFGK
jgi:tritrans,polycis-undecaprenyl-diphosphate synthase [geranylgeranyl-diphosphate specific]